MRIALIRKDSAITLKVQKAAADEWGAERFVYPERDEHDLDDLDVRPTDIVGIYRLDLLAARGQKAKFKARKSILNYMLKIFSEEAFVEEISTGRTCKNKSDMIQMYDDACDVFIKGKTGKPSGRPVVVGYSQEQVDQIKRIWENTIPPNENRLKAVRELFPNFKLNHWYALRKNGFKATEIPQGARH